MPEIPEEAVQAALDGVDLEYVERCGFDHNAARAALEAAAPILRADERRKTAEDLESWRERAEKAEARLARIRGEHQIHRCEDGHILDRTPAPCVNDGMCSCGQRGDRCPTLAALDDTTAGASLPPETPALPQEETTDG